MRFDDLTVSSLMQPITEMTRIQMAIAGKTAVKPAPTIIVPESAPPCIGCSDFPSEAIPLSDPRHPQHTAWLVMQSKSNPIGWYISGAVILAGVGWYLLRRPNSGVAP